MIKVQITYDIVSEESIQHGDFEDRGFYDIGGYCYSIVDEEFQELENNIGYNAAIKEMTPNPLEFDSVKEVIEFLEEYGPFDSSSYPPAESDWLIQSDSEINEPRLSFHFECEKLRQHLDILFSATK